MQQKRSNGPFLLTQKHKSERARGQRARGQRARSPARARGPGARGQVQGAAGCIFRSVTKMQMLQGAFSDRNSNVPCSRLHFINCRVDFDFFYKMQNLQGGFCKKKWACIYFYKNHRFFYKHHRFFFF